MVALALTACGGGGSAPDASTAAIDAAPTPTYVDASWQTHCRDLTGGTIAGCTAGAAQMLYGFDGDTGQSVSCRWSGTGSLRHVTLAAGAGDAGFDLDAAMVPAAGGNPVGSCTFGFTEGGVRREASCSGAVPSTSVPCQISVENGIDAASMLPITTIHARCVGVDGTSGPLGFGHPGDATAPALLRFYACVGD